MIQPFGNTTTLPPAEWHPEPLFRGTFSILSSCLITMSLCIWTSIHLNVPEHKKQHLQTHRKVGWMILGLLAPELVVWNAWEQRKKVKRLSKKMKREGLMPEEITAYEKVHGWFVMALRNIRICLLLEAAEDQSPEPKPHRPYKGRVHAWTDTHSWLFVMGGVAFEDLAPEDQRFMPGGRQRIPLTSEGLDWMIEYTPEWTGLIPDISRHTIEDKSKSDRLARVLTCWQAGYFCIQCTFRLSQQLSITLLELNVFAHAICALLLLLIWWNKPRDIGEPLLIHHEKALDVCARLCLHRTSYIRSPVLSRIPLLPLFNPHPAKECLEIDSPRSFSIVVYDAPPRQRACDIVAVSGHVYYDFLKVKDTYWTFNEDWAERVSSSNNSTVTQFTLNSYDINRLVRAYKLQRDVPRLVKEALLDFESFQTTHLITRIGNWSLKTEAVDNLLGTGIQVSETLKQPQFGLLAFGVTIAGAFYGGLHLTAWSSRFPSSIETLMWRAASITILATGPLYASLAICSTLTLDILIWIAYKLPWNALQEPMLIICFFTNFLMFLILPLIWYILCRSFIVVECFIQVAHIPQSALNVPAWSAYIPHIV